MRDGRTFSTSINRQPVTELIELGADGFDGDSVADTVNHGGVDKAVCVYPHEHYAPWGQLLTSNLSPPAFGENLTTSGLLEDDVAIGDSYRIGTAVVEVSQPRQPCYKLADKHDERQLPAWVNERGWTGFYLRVLEVGSTRVRDEIIPLDRPHSDLTVALATATLLDKSAPDDIVRRFADLPQLSESWRQWMHQRL